jgi:hypothetical protein
LIVGLIRTGTTVPVLSLKNLFMNFLLWPPDEKLNIDNKKSTTMKKIITPDFLRAMALSVLLVGAAGSVGLVLMAGRNTPVLLLVLFVGWVLSPFIALLVANRVSKRWPVPARATISCLMLVMTLGSLVGYSGAFNSPDTKTAFIFLVIPFISWLLMVTVIPITRRLSRRNIHKT